MRRLALELCVWQAALMQTRSRQTLVNKLELKKGASVLETGTGTGIALLSIARQVGKQGQIYASDISAGMLKVAQKKMKAKKIRAELAQANASYLPYRAAVFDAVLHIGGFNTFANKKRAIEEMNRVARPGARVLICDEGMAPGKENSWRGRRLLKHDSNEQYSMKPPTALVLDSAESLKTYWVWNDFYWVVEFTAQVRHAP